ncbi:MAG: glycosyltransferase [Candidatus Tectomicrobia bacterium]|nr:glycosyltransferase [Candidatus Tectomicrobia bacterium]
MRILVATHDQADGPGTEPYGYRRALDRLGHETEVFYYRKKTFLYSNFRKAWVRRMNARLLRRAREWKADVLLVFRGGYVSAETVRAVNRTTSCLTVNFYPDNPFGLATYPPLPFEALRAYRLFLTRDRYFERELLAQGTDNVRYQPHGYDPEFYCPPELTEEDRGRFGAEVSFVGSAYPFRVAFLDGIGPGVDLRIWGRPGWERAESAWVRERYRGGPVSQEEKVRVYAASRINLSLQHPGGAVLGLDERSFGVVGSGGFLMVNHKEGVREFFEPGSEIATYRDREGLRRLIGHHLSRPEETAEMARRAHERAKREHTHLQRAQSLLEILGGLK